MIVSKDFEGDSRVLFQGFIRTFEWTGLLKP
jgi:hypothetical protein